MSGDVPDEGDAPDEPAERDAEEADDAVEEAERRRVEHAAYRGDFDSYDPPPRSERWRG